MNLPLKNNDSAELKALDLAHHLPAQADYALLEQLGGSRIITHAEGCVITDIDGQSLLDGMAGLWCVNVGYGRSELAEAAYKQMLELPYYNTFFKTATAPAVRLAAKIAEKMVLGNPDLKHVFFNSSGSEANDTVFRLVRHYWTLKGEPERQVFISRRNAYHGSTVAGASLGGMTFMHAQGGLPIPGIEHVRQPYLFGEGFGQDPDAFADACVQDIEDRILSVGPDKVAAFIGEPVQGAGGVVIPPESYWPKVEALCRKYGILLICDEVICGFGRLGQWFGHQHYGVKPDIIAMAKGLSSGYLPISAVGVSSHIVEVLKTGGDFVHGYTYSGHPAACAVALANIGIIEREGLIERTREVTGPYLAKALKRLDGHPLVGEARSIGLLGAVEIVAEKGTNTRFKGAEGHAGPVVRDICIRNGLMVRGIRDTIVMCPPLIITEAEIDRIVDILEVSLNEAEPVLRAL
ncbi:aspartate aminotransferase family protein [Asticcacaulis excentricus]|uniref:Omega-amino acid--pyruvate aminotransferase n=1 Tax=Asticcacaulis excentricus TaxID=78587 RepID=A0A3G9G5Z9_9CAUL|nr:aspartate aminotransferase family protein [Asticcacaulis excentricus]BBF79649.1 Omega-amino acid--pyruvate aminotransferase [Asticcacaulis excentricus]